jgi:hypothetical protein
MRAGQIAEAIQLYKSAADFETKALNEVTAAKPRTLGATALSAVSLWYKAHEYVVAESTAHILLARRDLPKFAVEELKSLLQTLWSETAMEKAGVKFIGGEVLVSVSGGEIVTGGAPLDLILRKVEEVRALIFRTAEYLVQAPHRKRGLPSEEIQQICRPWLFQAAPGSYQFAVRVQSPPQLPMFPGVALKVEEVTPKLLQIVRASAEEPEGTLPQIVPDPEYRSTFLKLTRNLAPTGKSYTQVEVKPVWPSEQPAVTLRSQVRDAISGAIRHETMRTPQPRGRKQTTLKGVLRALHLDKDWLEITVRDESGERHIRVLRAGEAVDDVIGSMVNRMVSLDVSVSPAGRHYLIDIQPVD